MTNYELQIIPYILNIYLSTSAHLETFCGANLFFVTILKEFLCGLVGFHSHNSKNSFQVSIIDTDN